MLIRVVWLFYHRDIMEKTERTDQPMRFILMWAVNNIAK